jgi:predicted dehydrogenase
MTMGNTLTMGIVGCGYWGPNLIRNFWTLPQSTVKTVCDFDQDRLAHMKTLYQVNTETNYDTMISDPEIEAVAIATPVSSHYELAKKSLGAGKHTYIEKPMTYTVREGKELIELARKNNLTLMVGHTFIYSAPVRKIKEIVQSGEIGDLLYINSQRLNLGLFQNDINVAWDLAPHDLSIILYIMGDPPESVNCQGKNHIHKNIEDVTNMSFSFPGGRFATVLSSWLDPNKVRRMAFVGSKKMILYDDLNPIEKLRIYDKHVELPAYYDTFGEFNYAYHYGDMYVPYIKQQEPLKVQCQHFIDCVRKGTSCESSGEEGLRVVEILEAATQSIKNDGMKIYLKDINMDREKTYKIYTGGAGYTYPEKRVVEGGRT